MIFLVLDIFHIVIVFILLLKTLLLKNIDSGCFKNDWREWFQNSVAFQWLHVTFFSFEAFCATILKKCVLRTQGPVKPIQKPWQISPPQKNAWLSMWQQDCFLNSWISSNSCNLLLPAEISAGKWDFILNTHLSIPLPCMSLCSHCQKEEENDAQVLTTACLF